MKYKQEACFWPIARTGSGDRPGNVILFDLGGTLVQYFERSEFPDILRRSIAEVHRFLSQSYGSAVSLEDVYQRMKDEDTEDEDYRVRPLEGRLTRIFQLEPVLAKARNSTPAFMMSICRCFVKPIFDRGRCYDDTIPVLEELSARGLRMAIVSNTTWGSPAELWREEINRLGVRRYMEVIVFCRDVGWRKPDRRIFEFTLEKLRTIPQRCIFVGDNPKWDIAGAMDAGIEAILIDRRKATQDPGERSISNLYELLSRV